MKQASYRSAIIELKTVLQEQPDNVEARKLLGQAFIKTQAYSNAEKELSKARSLGASDEETLPPLLHVYTRMGEPQKALSLEIPKSGLSRKALGDAYTAQAEAHLALGNLEEAEQALTLASQADSKLASMLLTRAKLSVVNKQMDQASQWVSEALQSDPQYSEALFFKAALLENDKKNADAEKIYQQIITADPSQTNAYLGLAGLQLRRNDIKAADTSVQAAEKLAPKAPLVKYTRGTLELQRGNLRLASSNLLEVLQSVPNHVPSLLAYTLVNYGQGNYEQSIKYANKVVELSPGNAVASKLLTSSQMKMGDSKAAIKSLESYFTKNPEDPELLALAGEAYSSIGETLKAQNYFERAASLSPANSKLKTRLAASQLALGNRDEALADLESAASMSGKVSEADINLILFYLKGKEFDSALQAVARLEKKLPNSPITYNFRAAALLGKQDELGARKALEQALVIDPKFFPAASNLARMDLRQGKIHVARQRFLKVLEKDKKNIASMVALADIAALQKLDKDYVVWLRKAIQTDPSALAPSGKLVQYYLRTKEDKKALDLAQNTLNANRENTAALNLLGATQLATGNNSAALSTFTRVIEKTPNSSDAYLNLAFAQNAAKQTVTARNSLNTALQLNPKSIKAQDMLMRMELANKKPDAAVQVGRAIQSQQPKSPLGFEREGDIQFLEKQYPKAIAAYERAVELGGGPTNVIKLHRALIASGQIKTAEHKLAIWLKNNPSDTVIRTHLAEIYLQTQREQKAIEQYQLILQAQPNNIVALNNLATLYQQKKDPRTLATAQKAYAVAPEHPGIQDTLGWILVERGQLEQGIRLLNKAVTKTPDVASIRYHLGVAMARSGKKEAAKKELALSIKLGQKFPELDKARALLNSL